MAEQVDRWKVVYPAYFDAGKKRSEGRRIGVERCVQAPTIEEVAEVCAGFEIPCELEPTKQYSRDWYSGAGRVRVLLHKADGTPCCSLAPNKLKLLALLGEQVPRVREFRRERSRGKGAGGAAGGAGGAPSSGGGGAAAAGAKKKKKGKRGSGKKKK